VFHRIEIKIKFEFKVSLTMTWKYVINRVHVLSTIPQQSRSTKKYLLANDATNETLD